MPRYIDTGLKKPRQHVGYWFDDNLVAGIRSFRCQFGYFRFDALRPFGDIIQGVAEMGGPVHLVLGSNSGSLVAQDAQMALRIADGRDTSLTVVAFSDAEFHPKTIHIVRADGSSTAVVGSANLTGRGLARNVEASVILDSRTDDPDLLREIADAIDRWHLIPENELRAEGAYHIGSDIDLQALADAAIINVPQVVKRARSFGSTGMTGLTNRSAAWTPSRNVARPRIPAPIPLPVEIDLTPEPVHTSSAAEGATPGAAYVLKWCKKLGESDAQRPKKGNPTGKLRLSKAGFPINKDTWFRYDFFNTAWQAASDQNGKPIDVTTVIFEVRVNGRSLGYQNLTVDHGMHRLSNQNNVTAILTWGDELNQEMRDHSHVGHWVVLARDLNNRFYLTVQEHRPHWALS